ncbi:MAG: hypothetical protein ABL977_06650 [Candidatus Eisenbacteria bacterium]
MGKSKSLFQRLAESSRLPAALLGIGLLALFTFPSHQRGFANGHHGYLSSHGMALAANLSASTHFLMFNRMHLEPGGGVTFEAYNRFPVAAFAIIKLFIMPFGGDLGMQVEVARGVMLAFFAAAAVLAWMSIRRLVASPWVATAATLCAMSSYFCLYYSDMVFNDIPTLFGMSLVFHGMVVFVQEGRFRQLLVKSVAGLLLGWQVYALLLPFVLLGGVEVMATSRSVWVALKSRYVALGGVALLCGLALLAGNLFNEQSALGVPFTKLPTLQKMLWRFGLAPPAAYNEFGTFLNWRDFGTMQLLRVGVMSLPRWLAPAQMQDSLLMLVGVGAILVSLLAAAASRHRVLLFSLALSGAAWALPMRHFVAFHDFQSVYYLGIPMIAFTAIACRAERWSRVLGIVLAGVALTGFVASTLQMNAAKSRAAANGSNALTADFERIDDIVGPGHTVFMAADSTVVGGGGHVADFYLAGRYLQSGEASAEFVISQFRHEGPALRTPGNARVFLYQNTHGPEAESRAPAGVAPHGGPASLMR